MKVIIAMGSQSDWAGCMQAAAKTLTQLDIPHKAVVCSAHRTPARIEELVQLAAQAGVQVIIAGAGGAAHLPGMLASASLAIPVVGVPVKSSALSGMDSLLSIVQMPGGVPVGTMSIGEAGAKNAAIFAATIVGISDTTVRNKVIIYRQALSAAVPLYPEG